MFVDDRTTQLEKRKYETTLFYNLQSANLKGQLVRESSQLGDYGIQGALACFTQ